ncbi:MAG TPA: KH domain-containing protein [Haloplasmataceae bacterium]
MNLENLIKTMIDPLVEFKDEVIVKQFDEDADGYIVYEVIVNPADLGRVIGKGGRIAQAIRTVCYAAATKHDKRVRINFDSF